jgi:hypothetical protein
MQRRHLVLDVPAISETGPIGQLRAQTAGEALTVEALTAGRQPPS